MSQENVEIVRDALAAGASGDAMAGERFYDDSLEWDMSGVTGWPEKRVYRGREEVVPFLQAWADSWQDWHFDIEEVLDADTERVFAAIHEWGIGAGSGASVDQHRYFAMTLREGQIVRVQMFSERSDALTAVGLVSGSANVELVRRAFTHFTERGEPNWALMHEEIETYDHDIMDAGDYRGHSGHRRWLQEWATAWADYSLDQPSEYIDAGADVVVVFRLRATGRSSGVTVERDDAIVCRVEDGLITRLDYYNNRAQALVQVGLRP